MKKHSGFLFTLFGVAVLFTITGCQKEVQLTAPCTLSDTVADIDGNVYHIVPIGSQCWTKENLKTTRYADGAAIDAALINQQWQSDSATQTAAWCYPDSNSASKDTFGLLYNWSAVANTTHQICPAGWRVPTDEDFIKLINYLGGEGVAGYQMRDSATSPRSASIWKCDLYANNSSRFTALPAGSRMPNGGFTNPGNYSYFWSQTPDTDTAAWYHGIDCTSLGAFRSNGNKAFGLSVRCVKD